MIKNVLVSGANSGLGRYLAKRFNATPLSRDDDPRSLVTAQAYDVIFHCAIDQRGSEMEKFHTEIIERNATLTRRLARLPHKTFVHISSADVYPKTAERHTEAIPIQASDRDSLYRSIKILCEKVAAAEVENLLTLRPVAMLGKFARPNSLIRMLRDRRCELTLHADSILNYILHRHVGDFAEAAIEQELLGAFNIASSRNMRLKEIAEAVGSTPIFGNFRYDVGQIDNRKAAAILPDLNHPTEFVVAQFAKEFS